jgi:hypothetical protein
VGFGRRHSPVFGFRTKTRRSTRRPFSATEAIQPNLDHAILLTRTVSTNSTYLNCKKVRRRTCNNLSRQEHRVVWLNLWMLVLYWGYVRCARWCHPLRRDHPYTGPLHSCRLHIRVQVIVTLFRCIDFIIVQTHLDPRLATLELQCCGSLQWS